MNIRILSHTRRLDVLNEWIADFDISSSYAHNVSIHFTGEGDIIIPQNTKHNYIINRYNDIIPSTRQFRKQRLHTALKQVLSLEGDFIFCEDDSLFSIGWDREFMQTEYKEFDYLKLYIGKCGGVDIPEWVGIQGVYISNNMRNVVLESLDTTGIEMTDEAMYYIAAMKGLKMGKTIPSIVEHKGYFSSILAKEGILNKFTLDHKSKDFSSIASNISLSGLSELKPEIKNECITMFHIPKTGGTSLKHLKMKNRWDMIDLDLILLNNSKKLGYRVLNKDYVHMKPQNLELNDFNNINKGRVFTVVRNPYERAISIFLYLLKNLKYTLKIEKSLDIKDKIKIAHWAVDNNIGPNAEGCEKFWEYISSLGDTDWAHLHQQHEWMEGVLKFQKGRILKYETLLKDINKLAKESGQPIMSKLPYENKGMVAQDKYHEYYTPKFINLINRLYDKDFTKCGYSKILIGE